MTTTSLKLIDLYWLEKLNLTSDNEVQRITNKLIEVNVRELISNYLKCIQN